MAKRWTHPSIIALGNDKDPVETILQRARSVVLTAIQNGWSGPPFDPAALAQQLNIAVAASEEVDDARTVPSSGGRLRIDYNPHKPSYRINFSLAHELAHTLFPDCREQIRHRLTRSQMSADDIQLETLCNLAAAEMLMPIGSCTELASEKLSIDRVLALQGQYQVSAEAVIYRLVRLSRRPVVAFCCSRVERGPKKGHYRLHVVRCSPGMQPPLQPGSLLPPTSVVAHCTDVGFTAKGDELWGQDNVPLHVECVGLPPFPGTAAPRILGLAIPASVDNSERTKITFLKGDATQPRGAGPQIIAHIVNDKAARWGAGFARAIKQQWPIVQKEFVRWSEACRRQFKLGHSHFVPIHDKLGLFQMIAQHGYGPSPCPRIRYSSLAACLGDLAALARARRATVHMPRIGCGQAGGQWTVIRELIDDTLTSQGVPVFVYDLPGETWNEGPHQKSLF